MSGMNISSVSVFSGAALPTQNSSNFSLPVTNADNSSAILVRQKRANYPEIPHVTESMDAQRLAYSAYLTAKRDRGETLTFSTEEFGDFLAFRYPNQTALCLRVEKMWYQEMITLVPSSFTFNSRLQRILNSSFCRSIFKFRPATTTAKPTTMCDWGVVPGFVNGQIEWCRNMFSSSSTTPSTATSTTPSTPPSTANTSKKKG